MKESTLSRRGFVAGALGSSVAMLGLSGGSLACADEAEEGQDTPDYSGYATEEKETDIVVMGSGPSGLSASVEAALGGARVTLIEKLGIFGGNAFGTEGMFALNSSMQKDAGIEGIPVADIVEEELEFTNYRTNAELWRRYVEASGGNVDWLIEQDVEFDEVSNYKGISAFECFHWWKDHTGSNTTDQLTKRAEELGVEMVCNTAGTELIFNESGEITGLVAVNETDGKLLRISAKAIILASGGFGGDFELVEAKTGYNMANGSTRAYTNDGAGYRIAMSAGGHDENTCILPKTTIKGYDIYENPQVITAVSCLNPLLMVNENGARFMREDLMTYKTTALYCNAVFAQTRVYTLYDQNIIKELAEGCGMMYSWRDFTKGTLVPELVDQLEEVLAMNLGNMAKADTLEELAEKLGCDPQILTKTVEDYNSYCEKGVDEEFGKDPEYLIPYTEGPYYAIRQDPGITTTIGGIDIDTNNAVVTRDGDPVPHLYAVGVDACELYEDTYNYGFSGGMVGYAIYSGRNAAKHALATYCA